MSDNTKEFKQFYQQMKALGPISASDVPQDVVTKIRTESEFFNDSDDRARLALSMASKLAADGDYEAFRAAIATGDFPVPIKLNANELEQLSGGRMAAAQSESVRSDCGDTWEGTCVT